LKRVLVTGGALGDVPIIRALKQKGCYVITSGNKSGDIGHTYSDQYFPCDYTDVEGLVQACINLNCNAIIPSAHDLAAIAASKVAHVLDLPGFDSPEVSTLIHYKNNLRRALEICNIPQPNFLSLTSEAELLNHTRWTFPIIVKPVDLTGGNGIEISRDLYSLRKAFGRAQSASPSGQVIVEEFLEGTYHGLTTIIQKQSVKFFFADNEFFLFDPFRVSATTAPSDLNPNHIESLCRMVSRFAKTYNLVDGLLHIQLILSKGKVYVIEICRRTPGDLYPYFVELATEKPYIDWIISPFLGEEYSQTEIQSTPSVISNIARFMLMPTRRGTFQGIEDRSGKEYEMVFPVFNQGSYIEKPRKETLAIYFLRDNYPIEKTTLLSMKDSICPKVDTGGDINLEL